MTIHTFQERLALGLDHEQRIAKKLRHRGWTAHPYGMGTLPDQICDAVKLHGSPLAYGPDLIAAYGRRLVFIDGKTSIRSARHTVSLRAHYEQELFAAQTRVPVLYVFGDFGVLDSRELFRFPLRDGPRGQYYAIEPTRCHPFDDIFGQLPVQAVRQAA